MMEFFLPASIVELSLQVADGSTSRYPQAVVFKANGSVEVTINLTHSALGLYTGNWAPVTTGPYQVVYIVYSDAGHTTPDTNYNRTVETWMQSALDTLDQTNIAATLIEKILRNRLELAEGSVSNWVLYDDDSVTPLLTWSVTDKSGDQIRITNSAPARRTRGT